MNNNKECRTANIVLAIVGLTVINLTFVILLGICANVGLTFFKCPTIANTQPLWLILRQQHKPTKNK
jgi:hypothetical protein